MKTKKVYNESEIAKTIARNYFVNGIPWVMEFAVACRQYKLNAQQAIDLRTAIFAEIH